MVFAGRVELAGDPPASLFRGVAEDWSVRTAGFALRLLWKREEGVTPLEESDHGVRRGQLDDLTQDSRHVHSFPRWKAPADATCAAALVAAT